MLKPLPLKELDYSAKLLSPAQEEEKAAACPVTPCKAQEHNRPLPISMRSFWGKNGFVFFNSHHLQRELKEFREREEALEGQDIYKQVCERLEITREPAPQSPQAVHTEAKLM